jgi:hypothetical protein
MDRVFIFDGGGELMSLPAEWTSLSGEDPFVWSPFRTQDLLVLTGLVQTLSRQPCDPGVAEEITP